MSENRSPLNNFQFSTYFVRLCHSCIFFYPSKAKPSEVLYTYAFLIDLPSPALQGVHLIPKKVQIKVQLQVHVQVQALHKNDQLVCQIFLKFSTYVIYKKEIKY